MYPTRTRTRTRKVCSTSLLCSLYDRKITWPCQTAVSYSIHASAFHEICFIHVYIIRSTWISYLKYKIFYHPSSVLLCYLFAKLHYFFWFFYEVNGGWTGWAPLSECRPIKPTQCHKSEKVKTRTCTNPKPAYCGSGCTGDSLWSTSCGWVNACPGM